MPKLSKNWKENVIYQLSLEKGKSLPVLLDIKNELLNIILILNLEWKLHSDHTLVEAYFNKILELLVLLQLLEEINSFFLMAAKFSIYFLHFSCIFLWKLKKLIIELCSTEKHIPTDCSMYIIL